MKVITAYEARKISKSIRKPISLEDIYEQIRIASNMGLYQYVIRGNFYIESVDKEKLKNAGFEIKFERLPYGVEKVIIINW